MLFIDMQKLITNTCIKSYDKNKELSFRKYWDVNNLYGLAMSQKLPVDGFKWIENISQFNKDFIENHNKDSDEGCFLEIDIHFLEELHKLHTDLPFLPER